MVSSDEKKITLSKSLIVFRGHKPNSKLILGNPLWHSLRIIEFGTQILLTGKINDYGCMNHLYDAIVNNEHNDWEYYQHYYQPIYNAKKTRFRLAEKGN